MTILNYIKIKHSISDTYFFKRHLYTHYCKFLLTFITIVQTKKVNPVKSQKKQNVH